MCADSAEELLRYRGRYVDAKCGVLRKAPQNYESLVFQKSSGTNRNQENRNWAPDTPLGVRRFEKRGIARVFEDTT